MLFSQKFHTIGVRCPLPFHELYLWLPLTGSYNDSLEVDPWLGQITLVFWQTWSNIYFAFSSLFSDGRQPLNNGLSGTAHNSAIATSWRQEWNRLEISRKLKADFLRNKFHIFSQSFSISGWFFGFREIQILKLQLQDRQMPDFLGMLLYNYRVKICCYLQVAVLF